jgi:hypothetical protein
MRTVFVDVPRLQKWLQANPDKEELLRERAAVSPSTLRTVKGGIQPNQNNARRINDALDALEFGPVPKSVNASSSRTTRKGA